MSYDPDYSDDLNPVAIARAVIGDQGAETLKHVFGGRKFYFPLSVKASSPLARALGQRDAEKLCAEIGGIYLYIPQQRSRAWAEQFDVRRKEVILWAAWACLRRAATAALVNCTEGYVYRVLAAARKNDIFDEPVRINQYA